MQTLSLALHTKGEEGLALPTVFHSLDRLGARFRRGQVSLVAAAAGGGKSAFALYQITRLAYDEFTPVPSLYFSADCDQLQVAITILAGVMNKTLPEIEELLDLKDSETMERLEACTSHIWWSFASSPSIKDIVDELDAYAFVYGEYPHHVVVDNLLDVVGEADTNVRLANTMLELNEIARTKGCHVLVLAHVLKAQEKQFGSKYSDGLIPIPRSGIMGVVDQKATLMLTLYRESATVMGVCMVKSRSGDARADASIRRSMGWDPSRGWFGGYQ